MAQTVHDDAHLQAASQVIGHIAEITEANFCVELWNGEIIPLGRNADSRFCITIRDPGVLGCILRRPTLETLLIQYATGGISYRGGDLITFYEKALQLDKPLQRLVSRKLIKRLNKGFILRKGLPLLLASRKERRVPCYQGDETPTRKSQRDDRRHIQFHYDLSNEFYELFLDPEMQYSCAYFTDWNNSLEQAQRDKLDMICRKLRLQPGDRFLDIGCGWGSLLCHAAKKYKVQAHGVTLSENQYLYARNKVERLGLQDRVTVELRHYRELEGQYDKIASIGMYEHVGISNYPAYFGHIHNLLRPRASSSTTGSPNRPNRANGSSTKYRPDERSSSSTSSRVRTWTISAIRWKSWRRADSRSTMWNPGGNITA
ncbi:hypothetical protein GF1_28620 [Desulfolithobacter dissulfuricans]|uniref:Cyclopropane-fatty-acyl-phospholipid synthase n=1 Tax=Desulfolithobacter dissulfuricans TaxID=2795293 RepID=A0A915U340_9BACT|nr:cyclopropane-fatty-acyl-phospholipid synthase family protein [Desulfolithobacter dissulfuricans]BCO10486.1 hypothetical protein GF1_28620 [Desulfolithobacter dissulfuricans]